MPYREFTYSDWLRREAGKARTGARGMPEARRKRERGPVRPVPGWMPQWIPGQIAGEEMKKLPWPTPSMQAWRVAPWKERAGLEEYAGWAGFRPFGEVMEHMEMMLPRTPRGAGYTRWQPPRQRA